MLFKSFLDLAQVVICRAEKLYDQFLQKATFMCISFISVGPAVHEEISFTDMSTLVLVVVFFKVLSFFSWLK